MNILYNTQKNPKNIHPSQKKHIQIIQNKLNIKHKNKNNPTTSKNPILPNPPPITYSNNQKYPIYLTKTKFHTTTNYKHIFYNKYKQIHFLKSLYIPKYQYNHHQYKPKLIILIKP